MVYHNTNNETGGTLKESQRRADGQENKVLEYFQTHAGDYISPSVILRVVFDCNVPLTSVRRAITNLTNAGELIKTKRMTAGAYGKQEHCWVCRRASDGRLF